MDEIVTIEDNQHPKQGLDALLLIVFLPVITFVMAITLLGIAAPVMGSLGANVYHSNNNANFLTLPAKPGPRKAH